MATYVSLGMTIMVVGPSGVLDNVTVTITVLTSVLCTLEVELRSTIEVGTEALDETPVDRNTPVDKDVYTSVTTDCVHEMPLAVELGT